MPRKKKFYAVRFGRKDHVVVQTWKECSQLVTGHSGAVFKSFTDEDEAKKFAAYTDFTGVENYHLNKEQRRKARRFPKEGRVTTGDKYAEAEAEGLPWD